MDINVLIRKVRECLPAGWTASEFCSFDILSMKAAGAPRVEIHTIHRSLGEGRDRLAEQSQIRDDLRGRGFQLREKFGRLIVDG